MNRAMTLADWSLLLLAALLLGSTFLFLNIAIKEISPLTSAALRTLIAAPICWGVMRAFGARLPRTRRGWISLFWLGLLTGAIPFGAISWGQQHIASGMGGIMFGTMPILTVVLAPLFLDEETFTPRRLAGGVAGLAGIVLLIGPSVLANASDQVLGIAITFLAPLSHTLGAIYARRQTNLSPPAMATGQMIFGALILVPLAFAAEAPLSLNPSMGAIGAMLVAGVFLHCDRHEPLFCDRPPDRRHPQLSGAFVLSSGRGGAGCRGAGRATAARGLYRSGADPGGCACCQQPCAGQSAGLYHPQPPGGKVVTSPSLVAKGFAGGVPRQAISCGPYVSTLNHDTLWGKRRPVLPEYPWGFGADGGT